MSAENEKQQVAGSMLPNIVQAFRNQGFSQNDLAKKLGKSEAWVSKLLSGKMKSIDAITFRKLEIALEIDSFQIAKTGNISPLAAQIAAMVDNDPLFARLALCARDTITGARATFTPRYVPTEEMAGLGSRILAITQANPDKPGKVAKLILQLLA
jgi:transcriptional regulator with XRE-family HTH domain